MSDRAFYDSWYESEWSKLRCSDFLQVSEALKFREICRIILRELPQRPLKILDFGCGRGRLVSILCQFGDVTGVDFSATAAEQAQRRVPAARFCVADVLDPDWVDEHAGEYDVVVSADVIEHLAWESQGVLLQHMQRLTTHSGIAILSTPVRDRVLQLKTDPTQPEHDFLVEFEGQPTANLLSKQQLIEIVGEHFDLVAFQEVAPLVKQRWLDLCLKAATMPFKYRPLEILTHRLQRNGKYAVLCLRKPNREPTMALPADEPHGMYV